MDDVNLGNIYGDWKILNEVEDPRPGKYYECQCICGKIQNVHFTSMKLGRSKRCWDCGRKKTSKTEEMIGKRFGKWIVLYETGESFHSLKYMCRCECGFENEIHGPHLRQGNSTMCRDCSNKIKSRNNITHGKSYTPTYKIWNQMHQRCDNPNTKFFYRYGGRGISVCERWNEFRNFLKDMGERPPNMDLDRIDNEGNYEQSNCRWISHKENCNNQSRKKVIA
jgi:hypothetical protein